MKRIAAVFVVVMITVLFAFSVSAKTYLRGDADMDGIISAADARIVLRASAQIDSLSETQMLISDMNIDNGITANDARTILRISAFLEPDIGEINVEDSSDVERTEISDGVGMNIVEFTDKFSGMKKNNTTDGTISYSNDYVNVVSDPKMIYSELINSISITGGDYMLCGVYAGMDADDAVSVLKADRWIAKQETASQAVFSKAGMCIKIAASNNIVTFVEYYVGDSLVLPEDPVEPPEKPVDPPENPVQPPEEPIDPPEEPVQPPEEPVQPPVNNEAFNKLPEQAKAFLLGEFGLKGYSYDGSLKDPVSMFVSKNNVKGGMMLEYDGSAFSIDMLVQKQNGKSTTYVVCNDTMKYCELNSVALGILGLTPDKINLTYNAIDPNKVEISDSLIRDGNAIFTVYTVKADKKYCELYMDGENLKRVYNYNNGSLVSSIDVTEFMAPAPADEFSLARYTESKLGLFDVFIK